MSYSDEYEEYLTHEMNEWIVSARAGSLYAMQVASALMDAKAKYRKFRDGKLQSKT